MSDPGPPPAEPERPATPAAPGAPPATEVGAPDPHGASAAARPGAVTRGRTRISAAFLGVCTAIVLLIVLLIFILENTESVKINFLGASGRVSLGVALLIAAVGGALVSGALGAARIVQLHVRARRDARQL